MFLLLFFNKDIVNVLCFVMWAFLVWMRCFQLSRLLQRKVGFGLRWYGGTAAHRSGAVRFHYGRRPLFLSALSEGDNKKRCPGLWDDGAEIPADCQPFCCLTKLLVTSSSVAFVVIWDTTGSTSSLWNLEAELCFAITLIDSLDRCWLGMRSLFVDAHPGHTLV